MTFANQKYKPPGVPVEAGLPGYNEYGVPLSACNGVRQDEHYWAWIGHKYELYLAAGGIPFNHETPYAIQADPGSQRRV